MDVRLLEVHARPLDRLAHVEPVPDDVVHDLEDRAAQAHRAGAADDEARTIAAEHDRGSHHARQAQARTRARGDEVVLAQHVVQVHTRSGHDHA